MEHVVTSKPGFFSFKNRPNWSDSRFCWFYAFIIFIAVVAFAIILKVAGIYESMGWRVVNVLFIIGGQTLMVIDYKKHKDFRLDFTHAVFLCIRTGLYFALLFLPTIAIVIAGFPLEQAMINKKELFNTSEFPVQTMVFVNWIETIATLSVSCFSAPHIVGFVKSSKNYK